MTEVELTDTSLIVHVKGADKFFALKSQLEVPLSHITGAEIDPGVIQEWHQLFIGVKAPGTNLPGVIRAGTYYTNDGKVFWNVHNPEQAITINLADETYRKLVIEVADPEVTVAMIEEAVKTRGG